MGQHPLRYLGALAGLMLALAAPVSAQAAGKHAAPVVLGPDNRSIARSTDGSGPLVMDVSSSSLRGAAHTRARVGGAKRSGRHARAHFALNKP